MRRRLFFRALFSWWNRRRTVCSWYKCVIRIGGLRSFFPGAQLSHGICKGCSTKMRELNRSRKLELATRAEAAAFNRVPYLYLLALIAIAIVSCEQTPPAAAPRYRPQCHRAAAVNFIEVTP
jgi:hypothetical protein